MLGQYHNIGPVFLPLKYPLSMKNKRFIFAFMALSGLILSCQKAPIVDIEEIRPYLSATPHEIKLKEKKEQFDFWNKKLAEQTDNAIYQRKLAALKAQYFKQSGDISALQSSDSLLLQLHERFPHDVGLLQALTANAISQHAFAAADRYIDKALALGEKRYSSSLMKIDVLLEKGQLFEAQILLKRLGSKSSFDYKIRTVKAQDQAGELDKAVQYMEAALASARSSALPTIINWSLSNLGDMYGHQGKIEKAYATYLEALTYNPADLHSLKGIAWIAFSQDKNPKLSEQILKHLQSIQPIPDYDLLLAELATYQNQLDKAKAYEQAFIVKASHPKYGNMYKRVLATLQAPKALALATQEIAERPHPLSYDTKAWVLLNKGEKLAALQLTEKQVIGKTEEPIALYHSALIYKENGNEQAAKALLIEAKAASFELGPVISNEIKKQLQTL